MPQAWVIGLGKSGWAAARLLVRLGYAVTVSDQASGPGVAAAKQALEAEGIGVELGHVFDPDRLLESGGRPPVLIVVSPGVPWDNLGLVRAQKLGWTVIGEMELAWRHLNQCPWVGITGTNGKTTTTALTAAIFQAAGLRAPACGNIGEAACGLALDAVAAGPEAVPFPYDWLIAELSSYQIEASSRLAPRIGIWTTFTPDHLSRHHSLENYYAIKASLLQRANIAIFNGDDPALRDRALGQFPAALWTSVAGRANLPTNGDRGAWVEDGWAVVAGEAIVPVADLKMTGRHNAQNLLMAVLAARLAGLEPQVIAEAVRQFPGVPHRLEQVGHWQTSEVDLRFINDSKATNYDAAEVGLAAVEGPVVLVAGGEAKAGEDAAWLRAIADKAVAVLLIGSAAEAFAERLAATGYRAYEIVETLENAVPRAAELGRDRGAKTVLLSPACASFDQFANFEARGDRFRSLVQEFLG